MNGSAVMDEFSTTGVPQPVETYPCLVCWEHYVSLPYKNQSGDYCSKECARAGYIGIEVAHGLNEINETVTRYMRA